MKKKLRTASICVQGGYEPKNGEPIEASLSAISIHTEYQYFTRFNE